MNNEKTFKASTGWTVQESGECHKTVDVRDKHGKYVKWIGPTFLETLREYFQNERDTELGRTRWPENPDYVIYRDESEDGHGRSVRVVDEQAGRSWRVWEKGCHIGKTTPKQMAAAHWYFTEGPGKEPERPWENAHAGEVWRLTYEGEEGNYLVKAGGEGPQYLSGQRDCFVVDHTRITTGRKLLNADGSLAE